MIDYKELHKIIRAEVKKYPTQVAAAKAWKVSPQYLGDVIAGRRDPGKKVLRAIGYYRVFLFEKIP